MDDVVCLPQRGDSAMILATVRHRSDALRVLVGAGADLNLQNEVRSVTVDTAVNHVWLSILIRRV